MTDETADVPPAEEREFEDLTLAEAIGEMLRQPWRTARGIATVTDPARRPSGLRVRKRKRTEDGAQAAAIPLNMLDLVRLGLLTGAFIAALLGNLAVTVVIQGGRLGLLQFIPVQAALPLWALSVALVIAAVRFASGIDLEERASYTLEESIGVRVPLLLIATPFLLGAYVFSADNTLTTHGTVAWMIGIALTAWAFTPRDARTLAPLRRGLTAVRRWRHTEPIVFVCVIAIMIVAAYVRFNNLAGVPAEMTSDHIEKLLDAQRVMTGARDIFFANNGGREPIQMYVVALAGQLSGGNLTFMHLKVVSALESLLSILVFFLLGRAAVGESDRRLGTVLGITFALLAAVGYWHVTVTRVSLRIMLTPLVTGIFLIYLIRLIRYNRRADAVMAGIVLGVGLYSYQALRMLPVVAVIAAVYVAIFCARNWMQRSAAFFNLIVIGVVSFAVFVPMFKYANERPEEFWRRAEGRILGEDIITETRPDGSVVFRSATIGERVTAFINNIPALGGNILNALGMYTYRGDVAWLHNAPNYPAFDPIAGAFLITGTAGWIMWSWRRREWAALFLVAVLVLMLIPSALAIANPGENPSHTRTSGSMPVAYLLAAFGVTGVALAVADVLPRRTGSIAAAVIIAGVGALSLSWTNTLMFGPYTDYYQNSWSPQREAGLYMRGFAQSTGGWGNVFILSGAHFFDYRGVAVEAGLTPGIFPNGDIPPRDIPARVRDGIERFDEFKLNPDKDLMFMYPFGDTDTVGLLRSWFPEGRELVVDTRQDTPWLDNEQYKVYLVPALGANGLRDFLESQGFDVMVE